MDADGENVDRHVYHVPKDGVVAMLKIKMTAVIMLINHCAIILRTLHYTIASTNVRPFSSIGGSKPDCLFLLKQKLRR